jgi:3-phenylpropionate/cinnamic acid dioxygenase small subunit
MTAMDAADLASLAARIDRIESRAAIQDLLHRYCYCCDLNDPDGLAACFTDDCFVDYGPGVGPARRGAEARREEGARDLAMFSATSHHLSNVVVEFETDDRARAKSTVYAWHRPADGGPQWRLWAQYHDVVARTPDGWRIAERRLLVAGSENFPESWGWLPLGRR